LLDPFEECDSSKPEDPSNRYIRVKADVQLINETDEYICESWVYIKTCNEWVVEPSVKYLRAIRKNRKSVWGDNHLTIDIRRADTNELAKVWEEDDPSMM
jgi:hypothetical protein